MYKNGLLPHSFIRVISTAHCGADRLNLDSWNNTADDVDLNLWAIDNAWRLMYMFWYIIRHVLIPTSMYRYSTCYFLIITSNYMSNSFKFCLKQDVYRPLVFFLSLDHLNAAEAPEPPSRRIVGLGSMVCSVAFFVGYPWVMYTTHCTYTYIYIFVCIYISILQL